MHRLVVNTSSLASATLSGTQSRVLTSGMYALSLAASAHDTNSVEVRVDLGSTRSGSRKSTLGGREDRSESRSWVLREATSIQQMFNTRRANMGTSWTPPGYKHASTSNEPCFLGDPRAPKGLRFGLRRRQTLRRRFDQLRHRLPKVVLRCRKLGAPAPARSLASSSASPPSSASPAPVDGPTTAYPPLPPPSTHRVARWSRGPG